MSFRNRSSHKNYFIRRPDKSLLILFISTKTTKKKEKKTKYILIIFIYYLLIVIPSFVLNCKPIVCLPKRLLILTIG
jgi:hypothetical protein